MTAYFVKVVIGNDDAKHKISIEQSIDIADFKEVIKKQFTPYLDFYTPVQLQLYEPDGITYIDPAEDIKILEKSNSYNPMNFYYKNYKIFG